MCDEWLNYIIKCKKFNIRNKSLKTRRIRSSTLKLLTFENFCLNDCVSFFLFLEMKIKNEHKRWNNGSINKNWVNCIAADENI